MNERDDDNTRLPDDPSKEEQRRPLQFSLRSMLGLMTAVSVLFGTLRWLEVPPAASAMVLAVLLVAVPAALGLIVAIATLASAFHGGKGGADNPFIKRRSGRA